MSTVRVIVPKGKVFDAKKLVRGLANGMDALAEGILVDFEVTTQTWEHQPEFAITKLNAVDRVIGTTDRIYGFVNDGTPPHLIYPKNGRALTFMGPYRAKTRPAQIRSYKGATGNTITYTRAPVQHPGTDARSFDQAIKNKWVRRSQETVQRAVDAELGGA